ncbi:MAG: transcription antitermination factor NusB [Bacilli bacterium]
MNKPLTRNQTHEVAMTLIYNALTLAKIDLPVDLEKLMVDLLEEPYDNIDLYIKEVVFMAIKHQTAIVHLINPHLVKWTFDRLNMLTQAIFLLAVSHYQYVKDVDKKVVIDNAVKLAKKFVDDKDYAFINAILDKVL